jgi:HEAT repeat protein
MMIRVLRVIALATWSVALVAQVPFEQAAKDLTSRDTDTRIKAVRLLKSTPYPEAAIPLAAVVTDPEDSVQFEAIAAAMNIYLAEKVVPRRRVALVVEVRNKIGSEAVFSEGPSALNAVIVPDALLSGLLRASRDDNALVALDALYAFGALTDNQAPASRAELRTTAGPGLTGLLGVPQLELRIAAARVIGRLYERRAPDLSVNETVGDSVVRAINDSNRDARFAAMDTLGAMRYERGVKALDDLYQYYGRDEIGKAAVQSLARIGHASSVPIFQQWLSSKDWLDRLIAVEGLARAGEPGHAAAIRAARAKEKNESVVLSARFAEVLLANGGLEPLVDALAKPGLHDQAMRYLVELAHGRTTALAGAARNPAAQVRRDIAEALGLSRDRAAIAIARPLRQDPDPEVALAARRALARLGEPDPGP